MSGGSSYKPDDPSIASSEADFLELLCPSEAALKALEEGWKRNPRDRYIASRLARVYEARGMLAEALGVVEKSLKINKTDRQLNYLNAQLLRKQGEEDPSVLIYYYRRGFTPGDGNYHAQFWYARYCYEVGSQDLRKEAKEIFKGLRSARIPFEARTKYAIGRCSTVPSRVFFGEVVRAEAVLYAFIRVDGKYHWLFTHSGDSEPGEWHKIAVGVRVQFKRGFTMKGAVAFEIEVQ